MPTFKLDGREIPFEPGDSIIQAAWRAGVEIPHYCWHPGLSVAANCRMCLVEIKTGRQMTLPTVKADGKGGYTFDGKPKLMPACQMPAQPDMEVLCEQSEAVQQAQRSVQEFLLLNHPVDCPICDQAGECRLQDYWYEHDGHLKRKRTEPVHKPKAVVFGPHVVYDGERCIMCTRCIRVSEELAGDPVLEKRERGNRNEIAVAPGRQLDHRYSLMTAHVCPVGALTSRDFRFEARVWFLRAQQTICPGCATGCNAWADFDPRYGRVYRLRPRDNLDVNRFWMCDDGVLSYRRHHEGRLQAALRGRGEARAIVDPEEALHEAVRQLEGVEGGRLAVVLSAQHGDEDNQALADLGRALGAEHWYLTGLAAWEGDEILRDGDHNPNTAGAMRAAGRSLELGLEALAEDVLGGQVEAVVALGGEAPEAEQTLDALGRVASVVVFAAHRGVLTGLSTVAVPVAGWLEQNGHFTNRQGLRQRYKRVFPPAPGVLDAWRAIAELARRLGHDLPYTDFASLHRHIEREAQPSGESVEAGQEALS